MSDEELMALYRSVGSQEAFAEIFRRFKNDIYNLLLSMGVKPDAADDLTQEVFIVVARRPELYDMGRPLKPWLLKIAILRLKQKRRNDCRQCRDGRRTEPLYCVEDHDEIPHQEQEFSGFDAERIRSHVAELPEKERAAIECVYFRGMSRREAAEHLGIPEGTISSRMERGFERLRERLSQQKDIAAA